MRKIIFGSLLLLAACAKPSASDNTIAETTGNGAAPVANAAPSEAQKAAVAVTQTYLDLLAAGDYAKAHALWDDAGAASGGSVANLKEAYHGYTSFKARAEEPSDLSEASGKQHIIVTAAADAVLKPSGEKRDLNGFVYLRRANAAAAWRIWGVDIRNR